MSFTGVCTMVSRVLEIEQPATAPTSTDLQRFALLLKTNFRLFMRNRIGIFWTMLFPIGLMLLFGSIYGKQPGAITYLATGMVVLSLMSNGIIGNAVTLAMWRERGILRRIQTSLDASQDAPLAPHRQGHGVADDAVRHQAEDDHAGRQVGDCAGLLAVNRAEQQHQANREQHRPEDADAIAHKQPEVGFQQQRKALQIRTRRGRRRLLYLQYTRNHCANSCKTHKPNGRLANFAPGEGDKDIFEIRL